jgi:hypothetical protein
LQSWHLKRDTCMPVSLILKVTSSTLAADPQAGHTGLVAPGEGLAAAACASWLKRAL